LASSFGIRHERARERRKEMKIEEKRRKKKKVTSKKYYFNDIGKDKGKLL